MQWKKQFAILWIGQAVSVFTSAIVQMALIWYITDQTKSATMLTVATLIGFVPRSIISAIGGVYIDRHNKRSIMLAADGLIAAVSLVIFIWGEFLHIPISLILVILFCRSIGAAFHEPALQAVTPLIVPKENLVQYAGYAQSFQSMSDLLSPSAAAILFAAFPVHRIMLIDIAGAGFAACMLAFVTIPHESQKSCTYEKPEFWPEFKAGFHALLSKKGMPMLMMVCLLYSILYSPIGTLFPLMSISYFDAGINGSAVTETTFAIGTLIGSFLLGIAGRKIKKVPAIAGSIGVYGLGTLIAGMLPTTGFVYFAIIAAFMGMSIPFYHGVRSSMLQMSFPQAMLGRIMSLTMSMMRLAMPVGLLLAGWLAPIAGINTWFAITGVFAIALAIITITVPSLKGCCDT